MCHGIFEHQFAQIAMPLSDPKVHLDAYACRCGGAIFPSLLGTALWGILLVLVEALQGLERGFLFGLLQKCVCVPSE